jgi:hypothetical protein
VQAPVLGEKKKKKKKKRLFFFFDSTNFIFLHVCFNVYVTQFTGRAHAYYVYWKLYSYLCQTSSFKFYFFFVLVVLSFELSCALASQVLNHLSQASGSLLLFIVALGDNLCFPVFEPPNPTSQLTKTMYAKHNS